MRASKLMTKVRTVYVHPTEGTQWVAHLNENSFDCSDCPSPKLLTAFINERNGNCFFSD